MYGKAFHCCLFIAALSSANPAAAQSFDFAGQLAEGGVSLVVILGLSVLAVAVSVERLVNFRRAMIVPADLAEQARALWAAGELSRLEQSMAQQRSTLARVVLFMVAHRDAQYEVISGAVGDIASLEMRRHQQKAYALAIVATVAPIVGLLGTVIGMIEAFHVIASVDGMGNPALLAGGISKALINTAGGLSIALPALGMHHFFKNRAVFYSLDLEAEINRLLSAWFMGRPSERIPVQVQRHAH
jgi:biopolymer transport protein ExbB